MKPVGQIILPLIVVMFLFTILATDTPAQPYVVMENTYSSGYNEISSRDVGTYENGDAVQLYVQKFQHPVHRLSVRKISASGEQLWDQGLLEIQGAYEKLRSARLVTLPDGSVIAAFAAITGPCDDEVRKVYVVRIDSEGNWIWQFDTGYAWPRQNRWVRDITMLDDDTLAVAGYCTRRNDTKTGYLLKLDPETGNYISTVFMDADYYLSRKLDVMITPTRVFYSVKSHDTYDYVLEAFTHEGLLVWSHDLGDDYVTSLCTGLNGRIYAFARQEHHWYGIYAIDPGGEIHWHREYPLPGWANDHPVGVVSRWRDQSTLLRFQDGFLVLLNGRGERRWSGRVFQHDGSNSRIHPVKYYPDGDVLMGYSTNDNPNFMTLTRYRPPESWFTDVSEALWQEPVTTFEILPAYPNPFNASTTVQLQIPSAGDVGITITDVLGRQVDQWSVSATAAGITPVAWTPFDQASGVYFLHATAPSGEHTSQKLTLVR